MGNSCKILAAVTADGLNLMGKSEVTQIYICSAAGVYAPPAAPLVCGAAATAYAVGQWAQTPAGKGLIKKATAEGCEVIVRVSKGAAEIAIAKGVEAEKKVDNLVFEAERTYRSLNSIDGINWLMRQLSGGY